MTSVNENSIGSDINQEVSQSGPIEQDQELSNQLGDLLKDVLNHIELSDVESNEELSELRESLSFLATDTHAIRKSEVPDDDYESISSIENKVSDLTHRVDSVESKRADGSEREELEERLALISSFFEEKDSAEISAADEANGVNSSSDSDNISSDSNFIGEVNSVNSKSALENNFDCDYFDGYCIETSDIEENSILNRSYLTADDEIEQRLHAIFPKMESPISDDDADLADNQDSEQESLQLTLDGDSSQTEEEISSGAEFIEDKLDNIGTRVENSEIQINRIENIEKHMIQLVELMESSEELPISELTDAVEKLKTDVNYNDKCTTTALKTVSHNLEQLAQKLGAADVLPVPVSTENSNVPMNTDPLTAFENGDPDSLHSLEYSVVTEEPVALSQSRIGEQEALSEIDQSDQTESLDDVSDKKLAPTDVMDIVGDFTLETDETVVHAETLKSGEDDNTFKASENEFIEAARRAARAASDNSQGRISLCQSQQSGQQAAYEMRNKISTGWPKLETNNDQNNNFITGFAIKPLSSRYTAVVASALFVAASSALIVGQISPKFATPIESNVSKTPTSGTGSNNVKLQPSTGIANDAKPGNITPKPKPKKREFAGSNFSEQKTVENTLVEKVRVHQYSASKTEPSAESVVQGIARFEPQNKGMQQSINNAAHKKIINALERSEEDYSFNQVIPVAINSDKQNANLLRDSKNSRVSGSGGLDLRLPAASVGPFSLRSAAATGNEIAQYEVASRLALGPKKNRDYKSSFSWFSHSAAQGYAPAQYRLGALYERGLGTAKDTNRARIWYRRAAENGNIKAMHNLAVLLTGAGINSPDYSAAAHWFELAANHDLKDSQFNLAILYENGLGVRKNPIAAYKWVSLSALGGNSEAKKRKAALQKALAPEVAAIVEQSLKQWEPKTAKIEANQVVVPGGGWRQILKDSPVENSALKSQEKIRTAQILLKKLGYDVGPIDGQAGKKTTEAIINFQKRSGDAVTGSITDGLITRLSGLSG